MTDDQQTIERGREADARRQADDDHFAAIGEMQSRLSMARPSRIGMPKV